MATDTAPESRPRRTLLEHLRTEAGLTREQLAVAAGLSASTVARAELGYHRPQPSSRLLLARVLGCDPTDLLNDERRPAQDAARKESAKDGPTGGD